MRAGAGRGAPRRATAPAGSPPGWTGRPFTVTRVEEKPYRRRPYAPFITSTLQQEAARKLRFSSQQTMRTAQRLYENGYITYMRTDSVNLSETAIAAARAQIAELYGERSRAAGAAPLHRQGEERAGGARGDPPGGRHLPHPGRGGQRAVHRGVQALRADLAAHHRLADDRRGRLQRLGAHPRGLHRAARSADFGATGKTITDPGFLRAYVESTDDENAEAEDAERRLPTLVKDQPLTADELAAQGHTTQPPARYTEASLVKALEELGIGRPSTYASIMQTIQDRGYVFKRGQALIPSFLAFAVVGLLERHFPRLVDYDFTAAMENELDEIAGGDAAAVDFLTRLLLRQRPSAPATRPSPARGGLKKLVTENLGEIDARGVNSIPLFTDDDGREVVVRVGRYGPYLQRACPATSRRRERGGRRPGDRAPIPEGIAPDELTPEKVDELFLGGGGERKLGEHPETGEPIVLKSGRYGPYVSSGERKASLLRSQSPDTLTLDEALQLLTPAPAGRRRPGRRRGLRQQPAATARTSSAVTTSARWSPKSRSSRSRWTRRWRCWPRRRPGSVGRPAPPLREMGVDPLTEKPLVIKDGRFGPYVTDGETNASLRRGQTPEALTIEEASEMLAEKRAKGPAPKKKAAAKKAAAGEEDDGEEDHRAKKSTAAKKTTTAKATTAKKAAPKKAAAAAPPRSDDPLTADIPGLVVELWWPLPNVRAWSQSPSRAGGCCSPR